MNTLTVSQLNKACTNHKYILLRTKGGNLLGLNAMVSKIAKKKKEYKPNNKTDFISFIPCDLNTYITHKTVFITTKF